MTLARHPSKQRREQIRQIDSFLGTYRTAKLAWLRTEASDHDVMAMAGAVGQEARRLTGGLTSLPADDPRAAHIDRSLAILEQEAEAAEDRFIAWACTTADRLLKDGNR